LNSPWERRFGLASNYVDHLLDAVFAEVESEVESDVRCRINITITEVSY